MMKLDDAILKKLADEDDMPDFVCPNCGGSFFTRLGLSETIECDTITDSFRCKWKGPESECLLPSRASLAEEVLKLRRAISTPAGEAQRDGTRLNRYAYEKLVSEDVAWLLQQPHTLERDHVEAVLRWSITQLFGTP